MGYEADDVIGTLAKQAQSKGFDAYMMTPDKDFGQVVDEHIFQYKPGKQGADFEVLGVKEICDSYEFESPLQVIDYLALMGDKVEGRKEFLAKYANFNKRDAFMDKIEKTNDKENGNGEK